MAPPASTIPPVLPPSVEEAYRRKCIQLRSRTQTVSDANDAARIRLLRMRRGIEKMRLERAFLLEQVARRVKPNDESSDGSPEPPPTPKQKPLRVKRGRRAPDFMATEGLHPQASQASQDANDSDHTQTSRPPRPHHASDDGRDAQRREEGRPTSNDHAQLPHIEHRPNPHLSYTLVRSPDRTSRIGRGLAPESGFDLFADTLMGPLTVDRRREIAAGSFDPRRDIKLKWDKMSFEERGGWEKIFREGEWEVRDVREAEGRVVQERKSGERGGEEEMVHDDGEERD